MLECLVYRSKATQPFSCRHLFLLLSRLAPANRKIGVTGWMFYHEDHFFEYVEGPAGALDGIWSRVRSDPRHGDIELLSRGQVESRRFGGWSMAFHSDSLWQRLGLPGYSLAVRDDLVALLASCGLAADLNTKSLSA